MESGTFIILTETRIVQFTPDFFISILRRYFPARFSQWIIPAVMLTATIAHSQEDPISPAHTVATKPLLITGRVIDKETGEYIPFINVGLRSGQSVQEIVQTDVEGRFSFGSDRDSLQLFIENPYYTLETPVDVTPATAHNCILYVVAKEEDIESTDPRPYPSKKPVVIDSHRTVTKTEIRKISKKVKKQLRQQKRLERRKERKVSTAD